MEGQRKVLDEKLAEMGSKLSVEHIMVFFDGSLEVSRHAGTHTH